MILTDKRVVSKRDVNLADRFSLIPEDTEEEVTSRRDVTKNPSSAEEYACDNSQESCGPASNECCLRKDRKSTR